MDQSREPLLAPDAQTFLARAAGLAQTALTSDAGKILREIIRTGPGSLAQHFARTAQNQDPQPMAHLNALLAEQNQHFDQLRTAIGQVGQTLKALKAETEARPADARNLAALSVQAEAIQVLTLLALKGQQLQTETVKTLEFMACQLEFMAYQKPQPADAIPTWIYYTIGFAVFCGVLGLFI
jgi:hypothetical protein